MAFASVLEEDEEGEAHVGSEVTLYHAVLRDNPKAAADGQEPSLVEAAIWEEAATIWDECSEDHEDTNLPVLDESALVRSSLFAACSRITTAEAETQSRIEGYRNPWRQAEAVPAASGTTKCSQMAWGTLLNKEKSHVKELQLGRHLPNGSLSAISNSRCKFGLACLQQSYGQTEPLRPSGLESDLSFYACMRRAK